MRWNIWTCQKCKANHLMIEKEDGVTPFMFLCRKTKGCDGFAYSHFYPKGPMPDTLPITGEWIKPGWFRSIFLDKWEKDHVKQGGLIPIWKKSFGGA